MTTDPRVASVQPTVIRWLGLPLPPGRDLATSRVADAIAAASSLWHCHPMRFHAHLAPALASLALGATLLVSAAPRAEARASERAGFVDRTVGIQLYLPQGWTQQTRSALTGVIATWRHDSGARLVLSAAKRTPSEGAVDIAERTLQQLKKVGWVVTPTSEMALGRLPGILVVADDPRIKQRLHQLHAVNERWSYLLTFAAPPATAARLLRDFMYVLKTARFSK
jgi:hypothetical protein